MDREQVGTALIIFTVVVLLATAALNAAEVASSTGGDGPYDRFASATPGETIVAEERENATVFTAYGNGDGHLVAIHPNGTLWRYVDDHDEYYDVDPVQGTDSTVVVAAMDEMSAGECPAATACTLESIVEMNLTTGRQAVVYERYRPGVSENEWHDVDRLAEDRYLIAGMEKERVFVVNTTTGVITWAWDPQSSYGIGTGGSNVFATGAYPRDWTHLNDVTMLEDGRVMVSMRNHDEVLFINRSTGVEPSWTLGDNNRFGRLYEQHQPDYIPTERGGPAVVVADSQNDRLVEYQRVGGEWEQTWTWRDDRLAWPRDADRLPGGSTLVTDTNGNRIFEVGRGGEVVWSVDPTPGVYDAERLGTGDESAGGESAASLGLASTDAPAASYNDDGASQLNVVLNAVRYVSPWWFGVIDGIGLAVVGVTGVVGVVLRCGGPRAIYARMRDSVRNRLC